MGQSKYQEVYAIVNKYDLAGVAKYSQDEYEPEVIEITNRAKVLKQHELSEYIKEVFTFWFGSSYQDDPDKRNSMAKEIKSLFIPRS